ncbi:hypothetical protein Nepgr_030428 [Nepenthes gracilis]|uniref:Uncharacterized protein n=1 Tax=Nepenthes gracilis TaxID=150966 RepID=A0AAD3TFA9_NEPGR|nr:hypothetical protein Nepgr_030428 [Nepenthes gracilis]
MKDIVPTQKYTKELEEHAKLINEKTCMAKNEVEVLKIKILELNQEKEHVALLYNQCMEVIYNKQSELTEAQEQAMLLSNVIRWAYAKLVHSEEQHIILERLNKSLQSEAHNLEQKLAIKDKQLSKTEIRQDQVCHLMDDFRNPFGVHQVDDTLYHEHEVGEQNSMNPSSKPPAKRELGMDKREVSNEESNGLKDSVQELRAKLETIKKRKIVKDVEHGKLRDQLQDVENSVTQLSSLYTEPRKTTEDRHPPTSNAITSVELNEIGIVQRKVVLNKVRRQSKMIERL